MEWVQTGQGKYPSERKITAQMGPNDPTFEENSPSKTNDTRSKTMCTIES